MKNRSEDGYRIWNVGQNEDLDRLYPELPHMKWLREHLPNGIKGFTFTDLDGIARIFHTFNGRDPIGSFKLIELKSGNASLEAPENYGKRIIFNAVDMVLRTSTNSGRYEGFYVIGSSKMNWYDESCEFKVNGTAITKDELIYWLKGNENPNIKPYEFWSNK